MFKLYKKESDYFILIDSFNSLEEAVSHAESSLSIGDVFTIEEDTLTGCKVVQQIGE